ncbi:MAG: nucleotidyltransferase domain-containing protein [Candidatus Latescibacterota bacterium]
MDLHEVEEYARQLALRFQPERIILFGSHAAGSQSAHSDVDLLVLMDFQGSAQEQAYRIRRELPRRFRLDLLVRRPEDVARRVRSGDFFLREILEKGRVLHERAGARVAGEG